MKQPTLPPPEFYFDQHPLRSSSGHDCGGGDACGLSLRALPVECISNANLLESRWQINPETHWLPLAENYQAGYSPFHPVAVLNVTMQQVLNSFQPAKTLEQAYQDLKNIFSRADFDVCVANLISAQLLIAENLNLSLVETPDLLTVWLHLTDRCNLRCTYCYLPHKLEDMTVATGQMAIEAAIRSARQHGYRGLLVKYAGGEPLLAFESLLAIHDIASNLCRENDLVIKATVLSNGTLLTSKHVAHLIQREIELMISVDGIGQPHNQQRPYAGGRETFDDVLDGIELAQQYGLVPDISITVTSESIKNLPDTVAWVLQKNLPFRINFYRENDLSLSLQRLHLDEEIIIRGMKEVFSVIESNLPERSLLNSLTDRAELGSPRLHTCGAGQSYLVFNQRGQVAKCQMQMYQPVTDFRVLDPLQVIRDDVQGLQNPSVNEKEECDTCQWKHWCTGGCPISTYRATGRYDVKSPNCKIYKAIYPEVIRLESLRLQKYHCVPL